MELYLLLQLHNDRKSHRITETGCATSSSTGTRHPWPDKSLDRRITLVGSSLVVPEIIFTISPSFIHPQGTGPHSVLTDYCASVNPGLRMSVGRPEQLTFVVSFHAELIGYTTP